MPLIKCSICGQPFDPATSRSMPFCSPRCRQIDLGRWLGEEYGMPYEPPEEDEQSKPADRNHAEDN